ncbi:MAG: metallophosphoesterase, partial [Bacteroidota bacterium]|nr:metallophosphoesterase [Bacteroidota bacterium]
MDMNTFYKYLFLFFFFASFFSIQAQQLLVKPYLQHATPELMVIMWETDVQDSSFVEWGLTIAFGNSTTGTSETGSGTSHIHTAILAPLQADTKYYYQVTGNSYSSDIYNFRSPALQSDEKSISLVAMSDMQYDSSNPNKFYDIVHDGVIKYFEEQFGNDINENLSMILIPGDLVATGPNYSEWKNTFFDPSNPLFGYVPVYPVLGNHEVNTQFYFKYFHLPDNASPGYAEHWWTRVESNVRIIGIDSNTGYRLQIQLDWLDSVLDATATDPDIDFVFAQLHHPHKSELWLPGEINYTGEVIQRMEAFTDSCGKPSIHFF